MKVLQQTNHRSSLKTQSFFIPTHDAYMMTRVGEGNLLTVQQTSCAHLWLTSPITMRLARSSCSDLLKLNTIHDEALVAREVHVHERLERLSVSHFDGNAISLVLPPTLDSQPGHAARFFMRSTSRTLENTAGLQILDGSPGDHGSPCLCR